MPVTFNQATPFDNSAFTFDGGAGTGTTTVGYQTLLIEIGFGSAPLGVTVAWTDVTAFIQSVQIDRGRSQPLTAYNAGTCTLTLSNQDYRFDPDNPSSPYVGKLLPLVPVRVSFKNSAGTRTYIYYGYVNARNGWQQTYVSTTATTTVNCTDYLAVLATMNLPLVYATFLGLPTNVPTTIYPGYRTDALFSQLAVDGTLPYPKSIGVGVTGSFRMYVHDYAGGVPASQFLQELADTEQGAIYVDATGMLTFESGYGLLQKSSVETFTDAGTAPAFTAFTKTYASDVWNSVTFTPAENVPGAIVQDATSITKYTQQDIQFQTFNDTYSDAYANAVYVLDQYKTPISSAVGLTIFPRRDNTTLDAALSIDLRELVTVNFRPPGAAARVTSDCVVEKVSHTFDVTGKWETAYEFSSADRVGFATYANYAIYDTNNYDAGAVYAYQDHLMATRTAPVYVAGTPVAAAAQNNQPGGLIAYAVAGVGADFTSVAANVMTLTVTLVTGRFYKVDAYVVGLQITADGDPVSELQKGGVSFTPAARLLGGVVYDHTQNLAIPAYGSALDSGSGAVTYNLSMIVASGAFRVATGAAWIRVYDVGPSF